MIVFIGQSVAAANVSCSMLMDKDNGMAMMSMDGMDHSAHAMHISDSGSSSMDCCGDEACAMNGCFGSPSAHIAAEVSYDSVQDNVFNAEYVVSYINPSPLSLLRPPISG
ncbi:hypothetical protein KFE80_07295 [bacterium SCSIO 12696]|nr:hypothetical protein KFE80_07295 [bacterium SCSIO 12696]